MCMYVTFGFEWAFAVGAFLALFPDLPKTVGFFPLTGFGCNLTSIAAIVVYGVRERTWGSAQMRIARSYVVSEHKHLLSTQ